MIAVLRGLLDTPFKNVDVLLLFGLSLFLTPLVPTHHLLARADLVPWATVVMIVAGLLRARTLGDLPLPGLTPRRWTLGAWLLRGARVTGPLAMLAWFDAAAQRSLSLLYLGIGLSVLTSVLRRVGSRDHHTAWRPRSHRAWPGWLLRTFVVLAVVGFAGGLLSVLEGTAGVWLPMSIYVGVLFVTMGLAEDRIITRAQRVAAGRRDGLAHRPVRHRYLLAALGPSAGLLALLFLHEILIGPVSFETAPAIALFLLAWVGILLPHPTPTSVSCLLHEVVPIGGQDRGAKPGNEVAGFDDPPKGALRLDPVGVKRLRVIHHWVVPVRDSRIEVLDDPTRPLWPRRPPPLATHVLGDPSFEPDPLTGQPQWNEVTIRLQEQMDMDLVHEFNAQQRRFVVLRPFSSLWASLRRVGRTYRWDPSLPSDAITILDASTSSLRLQDGDILVLSTEGVARAFELEIGAPLFDRDVFGGQRPPQLEDYVAVGG